MRILVIRIAAIGDMLGITPLLRYLKSKGNEVYVFTKQTGKDILANNPHVDKLILYKDELKHLYPHLKENEDIPNEELSKFFKAIEQTYECERTINLCESWEVKLGRHPVEPSFKYSKQWAKEHCDINYYEQIFKIADESTPDVILPEMFFTEKEIIEMNNWFVDFHKIGKKVILWGLSGSAANKTYPYVPEVVFPVLEKHKDVCFLTVGDEMCQILEEELKHERIINRSGLWHIRQSCLATKYADLVIAPDTGILHASGMYETPKIGLLNHTSRNNITKHFKNDFSLHASEGEHPFFGPITCAPCYQIHYGPGRYNHTCHLADVKGTKAPVCMVYGIPPENVIAKIEEVLNEKN